MPAAMPAQGDLLQSLIADGLWVGSSLTDAQKQFDLTGAVGAAVDDFQRAVNCEPFLSTGVDELRKFSPEDIWCPPNELPFIDLVRGGGPLLSVTTFMVGVTATSAGKAFTQDVDFFLRPANAPRKGKPYTWVDFFSLIGVGATGFNWPNSIQITGKWGYSLTVPDLAFRAVIARAKYELYPALALNISKGLTRWQEGDVMKEYAGRSKGSGTLESFADAWMAQYRMAVNKHKLSVIG